MVNVFVYRPGAIGDTVLTLPALEALRRRFPGCELTYAGNTAMLPLLPVDRALSADDPRLLPLFGEPPEPWPGAEMHVILARQPSGVPGIQRDPLEAISRRMHVADWLVQAINPDAKEAIPRLTVEPVQGAPLVIHPGAGSPAKRWAANRFAALAEELGLPLAIVSGPADLGIEVSLEGERWDNLPLPELARKLAGSRLFVGNDSGISHLAAAIGVPTVAIYVNTDPVIWGIRGEHTRRLAGNVSVENAAEACYALLGNLP